MQKLTEAGRRRIAEVAQRHGFSFGAAEAMLDAIVRGNATMAQFDHREFAGAGQWMRGGMTMVSDMFNATLKSRVNSLCTELSEIVLQLPGTVSGGTAQYRNESSTMADVRGNETGPRTARDDSSHADQPLIDAAPTTQASASPRWPRSLQSPTSTGAQNATRYAYFAAQQRLAIDAGAKVAVYDTFHHNIGGVSQQQSRASSLTFVSQDGLVDLTTLPVVAPPVEATSAPQPMRSQAMTPDRNDDRHVEDENVRRDGNKQNVLATIERLAELKTNGTLTEDEFAAKKAELLKLI
ncbi:MAG: SHOCT domain-containing protein [Betaproteobacteria bacterium]